MAPPSPEHRLLLEDYHIEKVLGSGGFSVVRKGVSREDSSEVAIKTLKKQQHQEHRHGHGQQPAKKAKVGSHGGAVQSQVMSVSEALVANEILVMRHIVEKVSPNPNVIQLLDVYEDGAGVHLVLELCSGGELFDSIVTRKTPYSELEAAAVIKQIANGLHSLHQAHIVHRDLKPENCLFLTQDHSSPLKIMDFGLSHINELTNPVVGMFGSIDYVAPESLQRMPVSHASDMWSVGVILYILLCGYPPFHAKSNREKLESILAGRFDLTDHTWSTVSESAKNLIASLLAVDPQKRPTAEELLQHPWVRGIDANPEPVVPEIFRNLQKFNARRKFRAAAIASVMSNKLVGSMRTRHLETLMGSQTLSAAELHNLHTHFRTISGNGVGVALKEFEEVLRAMNMVRLVPLAPRIFELFDNNRDGSVDMREIICGFSSLKTSHGDEALQLCFQMYDTDGSGFISRDELAAMLRALPEVYLPPDITEPGKLDEIFDQMDTDNDGRVSFDEFKNAIQVNSSLREAVLFPLRHS
uniref:calcium/calmodulin-dependent protein kinase n=1 Tax=Phaeoceros laevis TaxID=37308 RepID=E8ZA60_9EMBR|nr:calcium- and calmodulin-dependent protein kinase [Phaeoceros laevis]